MVIHNTNYMDADYDEPEICYKVVFKTPSGVLKSCVIKADEFQLTYVPMERTVPKVGKLFAFDTLENAKVFFYDNYITEEIWIAHGENLKPGKMAAKWSYHHLFHRFWNNRRSVNAENKQQLPKGTVLSDSIILVTKVFPK